MEWREEGSWGGWDTPSLKGYPMRSGDPPPPAPAANKSSRLAPLGGGVYGGKRRPIPPKESDCLGFIFSPSKLQKELLALGKEKVSHCKIRGAPPLGRRRARRSGGGDGEARR